MIGKCGHNLSFFVFVSTEKRQYKLQKERGSNTRKKSRHTETRRRWWSVQALTWNTMNSRDKERERHYKFIYIEMNLIALEGLVIFSRFFHFISIRLKMASICSIQSEFQYALYICPTGIATGERTKWTCHTRIISQKFLFCYHEKKTNW